MTTLGTLQRHHGAIGHGSRPGLRLPWAACLLLCGCLTPAFAQQVLSGKVTGHLRVARSTAPARRILVTLKALGQTVQETYCDADGSFGFYQLPNNSYHVVVTDDEYEPVDVTGTIDAPFQTVANLDIPLVPRKEAQRYNDGKATGGNPMVVGIETLADRFPSAAVKQFEKGIALEQRKKPDDAIAAYRKAIAIAPGFYPARNNLGSALMARGDLAGAEEQFAKVIELNQNDAAPYFNLGNVQLATGRLPLALVTISTGLRKEPESGLGHFLLGSVYEKQGKAGDAEAELKRSLELNPNLSRAHLALVNLYLQAGRNDLAAGELRGFLKLAPGDPLAPKAREVLARLEAGLH